MSQAQARAEAVRLLERVRIPSACSRLDEYPMNFSGGMRQRVVIAMALVMNPALVIADEPTTALDVTIQAQILELMADLTKRLGTSILLITHDLGVVAENCSRVIVMYAGEVVEEAATAELFSHAHHPYTEGLLGAMPRVGGEAERLATIPGTVPPPTAWPEGCRFRDRCPYAWERCELEHPPLYQINAAHTSRCHLAVEPERRAHPHEPLAAQRGATAA
jgi:oligopeptide/dipeptide ABC transporter ATP-binding protein